MGLDMYLKAKKYIGGYAHNREAQTFSEVLAAIGLPREVADAQSPALYVEVTVGYWRKANQIHAWFVKSVQGGNDDCNAHYVDREALQGLVETCSEVLAKPELAQELLPPQAGLFFGSTAVDEYYLQDLTDTVEIITKLLAHPELKDFDFYYQSSW